MLGLFGPKLPIDRDEFDWMLAAVKWMLPVLDGPQGVAETPLVLPTTDYFPGTAATGHALAQHVFDHVRAVAGMSEWRCALRAGEANRPVDVSPGIAVRHNSAAPAGTFQRADDSEGAAAIIHYNPDQLENPMALVATFAHELAHYLLSTTPTPPPGGEALEELATDLCAVFMGFGVFMANGAKSFRGFQSYDRMGWETTRQGYLSEAALATALALFLRLSGRDPKAAAPWLKPHLASDLGRAASYLAKRHPDLAGDITAVDLSDYGSA